jgi:hypothetical protein
MDSVTRPPGACRALAQRTPGKIDVEMPAAEHAARNCRRVSDARRARRVSERGAEEGRVVMRGGYTQPHLTPCSPIAHDSSGWRAENTGQEVSVNRRSIGRAFGLGLLWGFVGALMALFIEAFIDPHGTYADIWVGALAYPAFVGGFTFSMLLSILERGRRLVDVSFLRAAGWGALGGLLLPVLFELALALGLGDWSADAPRLWHRLLLMTVPMALGMAIAGGVSVTAARMVGLVRPGRFTHPGE